MKTLRTLLKLWKFLSRRRKKQLVLLTILMVFCGIIEVVSLGLVVPFLAIMAVPEKVLGNPLFNYWTSSIENLATLFGKNPPLFVLQPPGVFWLFTILFSLGALLAGGFRLLLAKVSTQLSNALGTDLGSEIYKRTLFQPYSAHISKSSSDLISSLTYKIPLVSIALGACLTVITSSLIAFFLVVGLIVISPKITLVAGATLGISYFFITYVCKKKLAQNSFVISSEQPKIVRALQEGLGGIRDIILDGSQEFYCEIFRKADVMVRQAHTKITVIGLSPRFLMESLGMVFFATLGLILSMTDGGLVAALPLLGALVLGVQRLLPALQQGYASWVLVLAYISPIQEILELLKQPMPMGIHPISSQPIVFKKIIQFDSVRFRYSEETPWILNGLSFEIYKGSRVGIVGKTGSGKSTCLDLLMGLLEPNEGHILIDGHSLERNNIRSWQRNIAHVPQNIFLTESSFAENIAFGVSRNNIDMTQVRRAARQAQIADFIESSKQGYGALVGERGIWLSGGQRQRIGIARALYKQAKVLILDEATSALDGETEDAILQSLHRLSRDLTILMIAHRLTSLKNCTQVISLKDGKTEVVLPEMLIQPQAL